MTLVYDDNERLRIIKSCMRSLPVDLKRMCRDLGLELDYDAYLDPNVSGEIRRTEADGFKISINRDHHENRKRFTLAHEIGHFIYHDLLIGRGLDDNMAYRSTKGGDFNNRLIRQEHEQQANSFAGNVLMPRNFVERFIQRNISTQEMANKFGVSLRAMEIREQSVRKYMLNSSSRRLRDGLIKRAEAKAME